MKRTLKDQIRSLKRKQLKQWIRGQNREEEGKKCNSDKGCVV